MTTEAEANMPSNDTTEIRALIVRWAEAIRAQNIAGVLADHSPDMLMFDVPPPLQLSSVESYKRSWEPFFASFEGGAVMFNVRDISVHAGGDVAFATALVYCRTADGDGGPSEPNVRLTVGLRKLGGRWTVVHEHHSVPAQ